MHLYKRCGAVTKFCVVHGTVVLAKVAACRSQISVAVLFYSIKASLAVLAACGTVLTVVCVSTRYQNFTRYRSTASAHLLYACTVLHTYGAELGTFGIF